MWDTAQSDCSPIERYRVFSNENRGSVWNIETSNALQTNYLFNGATQCTQYGFGVKAKNAKCWGSMSNLIDLVAADRPAQPSRPTCSFDSVSN
jgi:hypothetical protein